MIGVFDSGHGGLTVLRALHAAAPGRPFVYLGDHAAAPYGVRSEEEVFALTVRGVERLFERGCRLVILACNTASAVALRRLQRTWLPGRHPGRNVLGVLVPVVEAITRVPWVVEEPPADRLPEPRTVGVFATPRTVASGSYPREIAKRAPDVSVVQQACPELVALIEKGAPPAAIEPHVRRYVAELRAALDGRPLDAVVLGCTHYPLVADLFAQALPAGTEVLCQPGLVVRSLENYLERHPEYAPAPVPPDGALRFLTTGEAGPVADLAGRFFGRPTPFEAVRS
ncbi:glutamate racemase [Azospirillum sp. A39]|uniref:glutamate racemase n=1 Tax=Azospirillum sp. A39 TaxID=3462279 RepID=UPI004045AC69